MFTHFLTLNAMLSELCVAILANISKIGEFSKNVKNDFSIPEFVVKIKSCQAKQLLWIKNRCLDAKSYIL